MGRKRSKSILGILCHTRRLPERCSAFLSHVAYSWPQPGRYILNLAGDGPQLPAADELVDTVHLAQRAAARTSLTVVCKGYALRFCGTSLLFVIARENLVGAALRLSRAWISGARPIRGVCRDPEKGVYVWPVERARRLWDHEAPPRLTRTLIKSGAIQSRSDVVVERKTGDIQLMVSARHPSVADEVIRASTLWPFFSGRVFVGQQVGRRQPARPGGNLCRGHLVF